jgi:hypothetical protein
VSVYGIGDRDLVAPIDAAEQSGATQPVAGQYRLQFHAMAVYPLSKQPSGQPGGRGVGGQGRANSVIARGER